MKDTRRGASAPGADDSMGASTDPDVRGGRWRVVRPRRNDHRRHEGRGHAPCGCRTPFGELKGDVEEIVLDVRDLPMVGQIGRTLARMELLSGGERLRHVNSLVPWPLFAMLDPRRYRYRLVGMKAGDVHVLIWRLSREDGPTADAAGQGAPSRKG